MGDVALMWDVFHKEFLHGKWLVRGRPSIKRGSPHYITGSGDTVEEAIADMKNFYATANNYCPVSSEASEGMYWTPAMFLWGMFEGPPADFYEVKFETT